jgi:carbon storage regulator
MLVLSRQRDQSVIIDDVIEVRVVDIRGDKVRLGFNAPRNISIHRKEVHDEIRRENQAAAQVKPEDLSGFIKKLPQSQSGPGLPAQGSQPPAEVPAPLPEPKALDLMDENELLAEVDRCTSLSLYDRLVVIATMLSAKYPQPAS